jgi:hypothetical protein
MRPEATMSIAFDPAGTSSSASHDWRTGFSCLAYRFANLAAPRTALVALLSLLFFLA